MSVTHSHTYSLTLFTYSIIYLLTLITLTLIHLVPLWLSHSHTHSLICCLTDVGVRSNPFKAGWSRRRWIDLHRFIVMRLFATDGAFVDIIYTVISCYSILCFAILYYDVSYYVMILYFIIPLHVTSYHFTWHHFSISSPQHCRAQNKTDIECYYEPLSKCKIEDALATEDGSTPLSDVRKILNIARHKNSELDKILKSYAGMCIKCLIWYDMIWYDMIWYDMIWCDMIWYDMIWYDMIMYYMIWYDMIWYDMIWYDIILYDIV